MKRLIIITALLMIFANPVTSKVVHQNTDQLPPGCNSIAAHKNVTIHAGRKPAEKYPDKMYAYDKNRLSYKPCTKLTVTLVNRDHIRHQWMVHGLPKSIYPMGMFTIELTGPGNDTGTFILPSQDETLLFHCGVAQHMQKGMKGQIKVGRGDGGISNIPGFTEELHPYQYPQKSALPMAAVAGILMLFVGSGTVLLRRRINGNEASESSKEKDKNQGQQEISRTESGQQRDRDQ